MTVKDWLIGAVCAVYLVGFILSFEFIASFADR